MTALHWIVLIVVLAIGLKYFRDNNSKPIVTEKVAGEYDYIIVGGGSAGCVLASRLSEDAEKTVLLLEAGPIFDQTLAFSVPSEWSRLLISNYNWGYHTTSQIQSSMGLKHNQQLWSRGRVLGGSSVLNAMQYTRGSPVEYDEWESRGCTGWSYRDVLPYFLKSEDIQIPELMSSKYHNSGGPMAVSSGKISQLPSLIFKALQELGYGLTDYNSARIDGFGELQLMVRNGVRESTGVAFLSGSLERENLDISVESFVTKLNIVSNYADGVWYIKNNKKHFVRARKEVIISAGAINTPQLLMLSGIGPKDHLKKLGIPIINDLPVGKNLQDHLLVPLNSKISKPLSITPEWQNSWTSRLQYNLFGSGPKSVTGNEVTGYVHINRANADKSKPDLQYILISSLMPAEGAAGAFNIKESISKEYYRNSGHGFTTLVVQSHPQSRGSLQLQSTDPFDHPLTDPKYLSDISDVDTIISGIRVWERLMDTKIMKGLGADKEDMRMSFCSQHKFRTDDYWECLIRHMATTVYHHSGTCKMGTVTDPTAVVDPELRVKGVRGLRVVDTSIFPNVTSGNTNAPVIMVAEKAADLIRGIDTVAHLRRKSV